MRAYFVAESEKVLAKAAEAIRAEDRSDFSSWLRISVEMAKAQGMFEHFKHPPSDHYHWAEDLNLNKVYADRLPLVSKEFRRYSKDLYPFIDIQAILHLCSAAVRNAGRRRRLRASYFRMIRANGGTYVSWQTFRRRTRVKWR